MSNNLAPPPADRVGFPEAVVRVMAELKKGSVMTISEISRRVSIDRRTVEKVLDMLLDIQETLKNTQLFKVRPEGARGYWVYLKDTTQRARDAIHSAGSRLKRKRE